MAKLVQRRRGTTTQHNSFTGAIGEITHDTTKNTLVIHDGSQAGGFPLAREDLNNVNLVNRIGLTELNAGSGTDGQYLKLGSGGTLSFATVDVAGQAVGGDLTGTISNAQIGANTVGIAELNLSDGDSGAVLTTNGAGTLSFSASSGIAVGGDLSGTVGNAQIVASAVGANELATSAVTTDKIATNAITTVKINPASITTDRINDGAITTQKLASSAVTLANMADASVDTLKMVDGSIVTSKFSSSGTMPAWDGTALTNLPYDIAFNAGFDADMAKEDVEVAIYGELVMARAGTFLGESGYADTAPSGTTIVTIQKNGTNIYSTSPQFASSSSASAGTISTPNFAVNDRITFRIIQIGSNANPGQGIRFTLKCKV
tara:strand:- start:9853 stop:10977 length:1125 start_codon:yes stop_codon:yes gene_type:complete